MINQHRLNDNVLMLRSIKGGAIPSIPTQKVSKTLIQAVSKIVNGKTLDYDDIDKLQDDEREHLHTIVNTSHLGDKFKIPRPCSVDEENNRFEIMKGEIIAGNNSPKMIKDFKLLIVKLMNQKRRELLLELHNIKPFVGTYKAVLNAIDFFGYNNITLKEYWLNINQESGAFGKLQAVPVPDTNSGFSYKKRKKFNLPNSNLKKTSRFSLVYKLNNPTGGFDNWDIQEVEEAFDFTPEEVLIKLYGLKSKLQRDYLPLQAKIVDIT